MQNIIFPVSCGYAYFLLSTCFWSFLYSLSRGKSWKIYSTYILWKANDKIPRKEKCEQWYYSLLNITYDKGVWHYWPYIDLFVCGHILIVRVVFIDFVLYHFVTSWVFMILSILLQKKHYSSMKKHLLFYAVLNNS